VIYEGSKLVWHVQAYIFTFKTLRGVFGVEMIHVAITPRRTLHTGIYSATRQAYMVTILAIAISWMERSMLIFLSELLDLPTSMWCPYKMRGTLILRSM
jgi:hypothetical protein